jgi:SAM-dependent methyltransferase
MDHSETRPGAAASASVGSVPGYPVAAVEWTVGRGPSRVLELLAGDGDLTPALGGLGHDVLATDPSPQRLSRLVRRVPSARVASARAEAIPLPTSSVDVVVAGPAFRSVDPGRALPEVARVLRPGGLLSLLWNSGDHTIPWVRKMFALVRLGSETAAPAVVESDLFDATEHRSFRQWQRFDRTTLVDFVASSPKAASLDADERAHLLAEAGELYDSYGRGPDGLLMPWLVQCYRARVPGSTSAAPVPVAPIDDGLLIDFS